MENQQVVQEDEIDLRKCIEVIIKRKKMIVTLFLIAVIAAAILSSLTPKAYKATAIIMITSSSIQSALSQFSVLPDPGKDGVGQNMTSPWSLSIATHLTLLKSNIVLERLIKKLNLKNKSGREVDVDDFQKRLNVKKAAGETVVQLEATGVSPEEAKDIANTWAEQYVEYSQELISGEVNGVNDFVTTQFETSKKNLRETEEMVNGFKKGYKQDLMSAELKMKKEALNANKSELESLGLALKTKEDSLLELKKQIAAQEKFITVSKAITDDALWQVSARKEGESGIYKKSLRSQSINTVYQYLETRIVNDEIEINTSKPRMTYLIKSIESLEKEAKSLEDEIIQEDFNLNQLTRQVDIARKSYDAFSNMIQETRAIKAAQLGEVRVVSRAAMLSHPASRGVFKTVALAAILSLMLGAFLVFFMDFWYRGTPSK